MQKYVIALYIRLSIEDYKYDSLSIENQSLVLHEYAASMPEALNAEIMEFIDNGYSGTNFERPQVQKLIELVRANQIDCIIVKDYCAIISLPPFRGGHRKPLPQDASERRRAGAGGIPDAEKADGSRRTACP